MELKWGQVCGQVALSTRGGGGGGLAAGIPAASGPLLLIGKESCASRLVRSSFLERPDLPARVSGQWEGKWALASGTKLEAGLRPVDLSGLHPWGWV